MPARNELTRSAKLQKQTPGVCSLFTGPQLVFKRFKWLFTGCGGVVVTAISFFHRPLWGNRVETKTATGEKKTSFRYDGCGGAPEESLTSGCLTAFHSYNESVGRELSEAVDLKKNKKQKTHPDICGLFLINYSSPINQLNLA